MRQNELESGIESKTVMNLLETAGDVSKVRTRQVSKQISRGCSKQKCHLCQGTDYEYACVIDCCNMTV